jgi:prevent-host-death family protein
MKIEHRVKPVSYLKAHCAEIMRELSEGGPPMIITQNGEAKAVLQDIGSFEQAQETLALLKLLAMSQADVAAGRLAPVEGLADRICQTAD